MRAGVASARERSSTRASAAWTTLALAGVTVTSSMRFNGSLPGDEVCWPAVVTALNPNCCVDPFWCVYVCLPHLDSRSAERTCSFAVPGSPPDGPLGRPQEGMLVASSARTSAGGVSMGCEAWTMRLMYSRNLASRSSAVSGSLRASRFFARSFFVACGAWSRCSAIRPNR